LIRLYGNPGGTGNHNATLEYTNGEFIVTAKNRPNHFSLWGAIKSAATGVFSVVNEAVEGAYEGISGAARFARDVAVSGLYPAGFTRPAYVREADTRLSAMGSYIRSGQFAVDGFRGAANAVDQLVTNDNARPLFRGLGGLALGAIAKPGTAYRPVVAGLDVAAAENVAGRGMVPPLEVGTYGKQAPRSIDDGLTPDHIPSFAAVRTHVESQIGRPLTAAEARQLRSETSTIIIDTDIHQQISRTYGGRNSSTQIGADASDLGRAARLDEAAYQQALRDRGYSQRQINDAFAKLHEANRAKGYYP